MTGSKCDISPVILLISIMAAFIAVMALHFSEYNVNHFYDAFDTSNNHTIRALDELVVDGDTTSQAESNGAMCCSGAKSAIFLILMTGFIHSVYAIGSRWVSLTLYFFILVPY